ncbi:MAG: divergent PAP2 family protein [Candidatus Moraniibacteriota bacterium]
MELSQYNVFLIPLLVLGITRVLKFIIFYFRHDRNLAYTIKHAMSYGHMPSVHTALMTSMVTSIGHYDGITSGTFALAIIIAIVVVDDATRLRVYMGTHSEYLNFIKNKLEMDNEKYPELKERMGHRLSEVIAGGIVGFTLTVALINIL